MALTAKQGRFVAEYLIDLNATQAAIRAGYSEKTAYSMGQRLLKKVEVAEAIQKAKAKRSQRTEITQDKVVAELAKLGFYDIRKAVRWGAKPERGDDEELVYPVEMVASEDIDDDTAAAVSEVSLTAQGVKIKMADKRAALESLLKHLGGMPSEGDAPSLNINITSAAPVKDIRVTRSDA
nr:terminase small subunit [uncultured Roseovarius sp.]